MRIKWIIIFFGILVIPVLVIRIYNDFKFYKIALLIEYQDIIDDYQMFNKNKNFVSYLKDLKNLGIYNCFKKPTKISNFLSEFNDAMLLKGVIAQKIFPKIRKKFKNSFIYIVIPKKIYKKIRKLPEYCNKFSYNNYIFFEFDYNYNSLKNMEIEYEPLHREDFTKAGWNFFYIKEIPVEKKIDRFLIKKGSNYFIKTFDKNAESIAKIHSFLKTINSDNEIRKFIDENFRAIIDRNVRIIWIKKIYVQGKLKPLKLKNLVFQLKNKLIKYKLKFASIDEVMLNITKTEIFFLWKILFIFISIIYMLNLTGYRSEFLLFLIFFISLLCSLGLFQILILILGIILLNRYFFKLQKDNNINLNTYLRFIEYLFFLCVIISAYLMDYKNYLGFTNIYGIKIMFLLPFIITIFQIFYYQTEKLALSLKWKDFILMTVFGILIFIMILRSGNYNFHSNSLEIKFREFLEKVFVIRPRFKEFLIGYPALSLLFIFYKRSKFIQENYFIFYLLGLIGVSTTLNSFLHLHTPFIITVIRTCYGIVLGVIFSIFIFYIFLKFYKHIQRFIWGIFQKL